MGPGHRQSNVGKRSLNIVSVNQLILGGGQKGDLPAVASEEEGFVLKLTLPKTPDHFLSELDVGLSEICEVCLRHSSLKIHDPKEI